MTKLSCGRPIEKGSKKGLPCGTSYKEGHIAGTAFCQKCANKIMGIKTNECINDTKLL